MHGNAAAGSADGAGGLTTMPSRPWYKCNVLGVRPSSDQKHRAVHTQRPKPARASGKAPMAVNVNRHLGAVFVGPR